MIPKNIAFLLLCLCTTFCFAQELSISGTIVDTNDVPIELANVVLFDVENSEVIKGTSTDAKGFFIINNLEVKAYIVKISFIGFKPYEQKLILTGDLDLKTVQLEDDVDSLDEVTITVKKPTVKKEADRLVFNVENTALSEGTLLEVIRSTPGVLILDNTITVKNSTPTVYINDRKVNLSASEITQLLENSPANSIKKVEVITNPSAKYDAESGVVLNIVMSKNLITGYRGNIFTNYTQGVFPRYNVGVNQFYKTKKVNVNLNYSFTKNKINRENDERVNYLNNLGDLDQKWQTNNNRNTRSNTHNVNLNFDYFINEKNTLSFSANTLLIPFYDYRVRGNTSITNNANLELYNFNSFNISEDNKHNLGFDLDFLHSFKNDAKLAFNAHYTDYDYQRDQDVNSDYFFPDIANNFATAFNTNSDQKTNILTSQVDYTLPINDSSELILGAKASAINTDSDIKQFDIDQTTGESILNINNSNIYEYKESIIAAYTSYSKKWEKWNFSGGLRVEQTEVDGLSISNNTANTQDYLELFPTLNLSHQVSENINVYSNYKRSISRPNYQLLNPFNFFLNDNTIVTGNPTLNPTFTNKFLLGTGLFDFLTVEIFYKANSNAIYEVPIQDNANNIITFTPTNVDTSNEYGLDIEFYYDLSERWFLYLANSLSKNEESLTVNNTEVNLGKWYNYSILSTNYSFLKDKSLSANLTITRIGKNIIGLRTVDTTIDSNLSLRKTLFNKKATLSLAVTDLFNQQDYGVTNKYLNQDSYLFNDLDTRYIKLGFSYKFGNTTLETNERIKERNERERLEKN